MVEQLQGRRSEQSENGRYSKHGVVLVGKLSEPGRYFRAFHCARASRCCKCRTPTAIGVDSVTNDKQAHGGAGKRCEEPRCTLGRRRAGRQRRSGDTPGRALALDSRL
jgi:hypothetical protein